MAFASGREEKARCQGKANLNGKLAALGLAPKGALESRGSNCTATEHALVQRCTATEHATSVYSDALLQSMLLYDTKDSVWFVRA